MRNIPYGTYDVILGLPQALARQGYVVTASVPSVSISRPRTPTATIRLVPAVRLAEPAPNAVTSGSPLLAWLPYPGADHYSVSVLVRDLPASSPRDARRLRGETCWARSGVRTHRVSLETSHFTTRHPALLPGASYMWIVYAYNARNRLLSTSEHYADLYEPTFTVQPARKGTSQASSATPAH